MSKKTVGISRNKHESYVQAKINLHKKKNRYKIFVISRFKYINKD